MTEIKSIAADDELKDAVQASIADDMDEARPRDTLPWIIGGLAVVVILGTSASTCRSTFRSGRTTPR